MKRCPKVDRCPLFPLFTLKASLKTWQIRYCNADFESCRRYQTAMAGKMPPLRMLPSGKLLPVSALSKRAH